MPQGFVHRTVLVTFVLMVLPFENGMHLSITLLLAQRVSKIGVQSSTTGLPPALASRAETTKPSKSQ